MTYILLRLPESSATYSPNQGLRHEALGLLSAPQLPCHGFCKNIPRNFSYGLLPSLHCFFLIIPTATSWMYRYISILCKKKLVFGPYNYFFPVNSSGDDTSFMRWLNSFCFRIEIKSKGSYTNF